MNKQDKKNSSTVKKDKTTAIIAYITLVGFIVAVIMNNDKKNKFASFHIKQVLGLSLTGLAFSVINVIPILGWLISILGGVFIFILWVIGLINVMNTKETPLPVLGVYYQNWFDDINL